MAKKAEKIKLTLRQKKLCDYFLELGNATEAAIKAGYSPKTAKTTAAQTFKKPYVKEYLDKLIESKDAERIASQDEVLEFLTNVMRGRVVEKVPLLDGDGYQKLAELDVNAAKDRIKAAELLGKRYAMWTDKKDIDGAVSVTFVDNLPDDEE